MKVHKKTELLTVAKIKLLIQARLSQIEEEDPHRSTLGNEELECLLDDINAAFPPKKKP